MASFYITYPAVAFYNDDFGTVPDKAKPISDADKQTLLNGQAKGKIILVDGNGKLYLADNNLPIINTTTVSNSQLSPLQFKVLFTGAEQLNLSKLAMQNPVVLDWYMTAMGAQYIDLTDTRTIQGIEYLVQNNIVTQARANQILLGVAP